MEKGRALVRWVGFLVIVAFFSIYSLQAWGSAADAPDEADSRADLVEIDTLSDFGALEFPTVVFLHDNHTKALKDRGRDCDACHLEDQGVQSVKFLRLSDPGRAEVMDVYHEGCISCHEEMAGEGVKTGPVVCRGCHGAYADVESSRMPMVFDRSLHYRHSLSQEKKCEVCHHEYNEQTEKLYYEKGKESSCRYCHEEQTVDNRISMRLAAHTSCVECHLKTAKEGSKAGPANCGGCHDPGLRAKIKKVEDVPRMERKQPDLAVVKAGKEDPTLGMTPVPFDHKSHEASNDNCLACHHQSLDSCAAKCHTLNGSKEGDFVKLAQAMHLRDSERSCVGCHNIQKQAKNCAGCHTPLTAKPMSDQSCRQCHLEPTPEGFWQASEDEQKAMAAAMLREAGAPKEPLTDEDIPEIVEIKSLVSEYEAVKLPHRKIVRALLDGVKDSRLADHFHGQKYTVCQGCHHNSPVAAKPPRCSTCHGLPFGDQEPERPGLKAAYHLQCMSCHLVMKVEKPAATSCDECHKKRN